MITKIVNRFSLGPMDGALGTLTMSGPKFSIKRFG